MTLTKEEEIERLAKEILDIDNAIKLLLKLRESDLEAVKLLQELKPSRA